MAAAPKSNIFKPSELANEEEVEALETAEPQEEAEEQETAEQPEAGEAKEEAAQQPHEEAVAYDRFKQVNERNKALEQELAQHRDFRTRLEERQRLIQEANEQANRLTEQQRMAAARPNPNEDPIGAELYDLKLARQQDRGTIDQLQGQLNQFGQSYQTNQEQSAFSGWVTNEANTYAASDPHYFPAAQYTAQRRVNFWREIAPQAPAGLAEKLVEGESVMIARLAQQYGGRFAPTVAKLAREWGYAPANGAPAPAQNGGAPAQRPAAPSPQAQRLQQVRQGQRLQGLGAVPAGGNAGGPSAYRNYGPADIEAMTEKEFAQALSNPVTASDLKYAMSRADGLDGEENY